MTDALPADVERFLREQVDSIAQLEVLVLLHARPAAALTGAAVARELGMDAAWTAAELAQLAGRGLLAASTRLDAPTYRYAPRDERLRETVDAVVRTFRERRVTVIEVVVSKPSRHIRSFADAFRLRKD